jgi:hypothetical protein
MTSINHKLKMILIIEPFVSILLTFGACQQSEYLQYDTQTSVSVHQIPEQLLVELPGQ